MANKRLELEQEIRLSSNLLSDRLDNDIKADKVTCLSCKMFNRHLDGYNLSYNIQPKYDERTEHKSDGTILVVYKTPTEYEDAANVPMVDRNGFEFTSMYLNCLDNKWVLTNATRCYPGKNKSGLKDATLTDDDVAKCADTFLEELIKEVKPSVIVCLGVTAMKAVLKEHAAKALNKAIGDPIKMKELDYFVLVTYDPVMHNNGRKDLLNEYYRVFGMADKLASGDFHQEVVEFETITSIERAFEVAEILQPKIILDIEDNHNKKDKIRKTVWHPGVKIILLQITEVVGGRYKTYVFTPSVLSPRLFIKILLNRVVVGHNIKYDFQCIFAVYGVNVYRYIKDYVCTFLKFVSIDQGRTGNGLKALAIMYFNITAYDTILWQEIDRSNKAIADSHALVRSAINNVTKLLEKAKKAEAKKLSSKSDAVSEAIEEAVQYTKTGKIRKPRAKKEVIEVVYDIEGLEAQLEELLEQQEELRPLGSANFSDTNTSTLYQYGACDTHYTARLEYEILPGIQEDGGWNPIAYNISKNNVFTFSHVERWGLPISMKRHKILSDLIDEKVKNIKDFLISSEYVQRALAQVPDVIKLSTPTPRYPEGKLTFDYLYNEAIKPNKKKFLAQLLVETGMLPVLDAMNNKTKTGDYRLDEDVLSDISGGEDDTEIQYRKASWTPSDQKSEIQWIWYMIYKYRKLLDIQRKFMNNLREFAVHGRLRPDFLLAKVEVGRAGGAEKSGGTTTGRLCVAKGTYIECPRDLTKNPKGIKIEDIKVGDLVYSYDEHGTLSLRKVIWHGQTGSNEDTLRITWKSTGSQKGGFLDVTPTHRVRKIDGTWVMAKDLKPGDSIMSLARGMSSYDYPRIYARNLDIKEHMFIAKELHGDHEKQVHHVDFNKSNNSVGNLVCLTPKEHTHAHIEDRRNVMRILNQNEEATQKARAVYKVRYGGGKGFTHKQVSFRSVLFTLARCKGLLAVAAPKLGLTTETLKARCEYYGIDHRAIMSRYNKNGVYLSRGLILRTINEHVGNAQYKSLNIGWKTLQNLLEFYGIKPRNHKVVSITTGPTIDVYNMEVEGTHCFIANELAVSNSSRDPNLLNLKKDKALRWVFVAQLGEEE